MEISIWLYTIISVIIVSIISLIGIFPFLIVKKRMNTLLLFLVSFSAGSLFGGAFIHLLPEAIEEFGFSLKIGLFLILGIVMFFILEKFIHWRHCHIPTSKDHPHPFAYMNLVGDSFHNFIDGLVIAGSYLASIPVGISTTLAVIFHEIPQEMGDFSVLLHGGMTKKKALFLNFITALTAILGAVVGLVLGNMIESFTIFILPFTAGGFIYIAGSDLIPEMHKETGIDRSSIQLFGIIAGIAVMALLLLIGAK